MYAHLAYVEVSQVNTLCLFYKTAMEHGCKLLGRTQEASHRPLITSWFLSVLAFFVLVDSVGVMP